ncbi:MAG TPA: hypothetical protein DCK76_00325 [Desulfotomaculum sp.]|nr:MAG: Phosphoribosyltransferase [Desulfotomaculum sp. 46_80]HAG09867.1 hypothetical protein [Desulfotomaculum sp.]HBY03858.1 hypothetical protein [Desulfotomaculum sp.]
MIQINYSGFLYDLWEDFLNLIFPPRNICFFCNGPADIQGICSDCKNKLNNYANQPQCYICGRFLSAGKQNPLDIAENKKQSIVCIECRHSERSYVFARAAGPYEGILMRAIWKFKYGGKTYLAKPLGGLLAGAVNSLIDLGHSEMGLKKSEIAGLVPVPLANKRLRKRGFNQSELLARFVSHNLDLPFLPMLNKLKETSAQTGLSREQRQSNLEGVFGVSQCKIPVGKSVILIDDMFTTGSTVSECSRVLLNAGLKNIFVATVATSTIR